MGGGVVVVRVSEGARRRSRGVGISPRRGRALVSRVHGGGGGGAAVVVGEGRESELDFCSLGSGAGGQGITSRGQRRHDASGGISVPTQARGRLGW
jgi:hypothetical protein